MLAGIHIIQPARLLSQASQVACIQLSLEYTSIMLYYPNTRNYKPVKGFHFLIVSRGMCHASQERNKVVRLGGCDREQSGRAIFGGLLLDRLVSLPCFWRAQWHAHIVHDDLVGAWHLSQAHAS